MFTYLSAASTTWVDNGGKGDVMDLHDECLALGLLAKVVGLTWSAVGVVYEAAG
ncbi:hypothetical protein ACWC9T_06580 [Kitasatospora sp. NPDC001159]